MSPPGAAWSSSEAPISCSLPGTITFAESRVDPEPFQGKGSLLPRAQLQPQPWSCSQIHLWLQKEFAFSSSSISVPEEQSGETFFGVGCSIF